jgi:phage gpG-like protein
MFDLKLQGAEKVAQALERLSMSPLQLRRELHNAGRIIQREAVANVSNRVLHRRTGNLATSVKIDDSELDELTVRVGVGKQAEYGAAHEFGAKTKPHVIEPRFALALRFPTALGIKSHRATRFAFATKINHPGSVIPKRPWLLPAYENNRDKIVETFRAGLERSLTP